MAAAKEGFVLTILVVIVVLLLLFGIFKHGGNRTSGAWFTTRCPYCRQKIASDASAYPWCGHGIPLAPKRPNLRARLWSQKE
jgi:hypothetical protein